MDRYFIHVIERKEENLTNYIQMINNFSNVLANNGLDVTYIDYGKSESVIHYLANDETMKLIDVSKLKGGGE